MPTTNKQTNGWHTSLYTYLYLAAHGKPRHVSQQRCVDGSGTSNVYLEREVVVCQSNRNKNNLNYIWDFWSRGRVTLLFAVGISPFFKNRMYFLAPFLLPCAVLIGLVAHVTYWLNDDISENEMGWRTPNPACVLIPHQVTGHGLSFWSHGHSSFPLIHHIFFTLKFTIFLSLLYCWNHCLCDLKCNCQIVARCHLTKSWKAKTSPTSFLISGTCSGSLWLSPALWCGCYLVSLMSSLVTGSISISHWGVLFINCFLPWTAQNRSLVSDRKSVV